MWVRARVRLVGLCDVSAIVGWLGGMMTMMMMCRPCVACLRGRWVGCEMIESHVCGFVLLWFPV
jgi:hypothetical protein